MYNYFGVLLWWWILINIFSIFYRIFLQRPSSMSFPYSSPSMQLQSLVQWYAEPSIFAINHCCILFMLAEVPWELLNVLTVDLDKRYIINHAVWSGLQLMTPTPFHYSSSSSNMFYSSGTNHCYLSGHYLLISSSWTKYLHLAATAWNGDLLPREFFPFHLIPWITFLLIYDSRMLICKAARVFKDVSLILIPK